MKKHLAGICALAVLLTAAPAMAGGYDTPILYSARHMGMGGTAGGYVNDPSALFHNPAGLAGVKNISVLGDFSLVLGNIQASPDSMARNVDSELTLAPFFLVGGAVRITDWLVAGLAVYPVASAGAEFKYEIFGNQVTDETKLVFIEFAPGLAVNLPYGIRLGASYRVTYATLDRVKGAGANPTIDFSVKGVNFASFRLGAQWLPIDKMNEDAPWESRRVSFGLMYRHKTTVDLKGDSGRLLSLDFTDLETSFTLPARFVFGTRGDYGRIGGAVDVEYALNSQNDQSTIAGIDPNGDRQGVPSVFAWSNAITLRVGGEYRWLERGQLKTRLGYIFDGTTSNAAYPTAFGTPPAPTHTFTLGVGYDFGPLEANVAFAHRQGSAKITAAQKGDRACPFCNSPGDYEIVMNGFYCDVSYDFD